MKRIFAHRKRRRAGAQPREAQTPFDSMIIALAVWLAILVGAQLFQHLPRLPQLSGPGPWPRLTLSQLMESARAAIGY